MKYTNKILQKHLKSLQGREWYHQRFDGCPFFLHLIAQAEATDEPRKQGWFNFHKMCFFNNDRADWYIDMEDIKRVTQSMLAELEMNPQLSKDLIAAWEQDKIAFYDVCNKIEKTMVSNLNEVELRDLYADFYHKTIRNVTSSSIIDGFALGSDQIIADRIHAELQNCGRDAEFTKLFPILTAPTKQSFINEAEVSLLRVAVLEKQGGDFESALDSHQKNYFWSKNNYVHANYLDLDHFYKEIKEMNLSVEEIERQIVTIKETPQRNKEQKEALISELNLSENVIALLTISDDFTWWQDERKRATYWYIHYGCVLLEEIAKRKKLSLHQLKYMAPSEVLELFEDNPSHVYTQNELDDRIKDCAFYWHPDGFECVTGNDLAALKETVLREEDYSNVKEFNGLCASSGIVRGTVKVIMSATEVDKVEIGDILVAVMTRPDYIMGMKKSAAIVTNEGGVTCHAAIVSRELGIPCIIATKIATKVLKDGMHVEVNADTGVVRILD